jgi:hypothetical protein
MRRLLFRASLALGLGCGRVGDDLPDQEGEKLRHVTNREQDAEGLGWVGLACIAPLLNRSGGGREGPVARVRRGGEAGGGGGGGGEVRRGARMLPDSKGGIWRGVTWMKCGDCGGKDRQGEVPEADLVVNVEKLRQEWSVRCGLRRGVWRVACDVWRVTCDVWRVACGVWRVTCDV